MNLCQMVVSSIRTEEAKVEQVFISQGGMRFLALQGKKLKKAGCLAFLKLACGVDHKNRVVIDWEKLRQDLGASLVAVRKAVGSLVELNVLAERSSAGSVYQFNPSFVWAGDPDDHEQALEDWERRELIKLVPELPATARKPRRKATKKKSGEEK